MLVKVLIGNVQGDEKTAKTGEAINLSEVDAKRLIGLGLVEKMEVSNDHQTHKGSKRKKSRT